MPEATIHSIINPDEARPPEEVVEVIQEGLQNNNPSQQPTLEDLNKFNNNNPKTIEKRIALPIYNKNVNVNLWNDDRISQTLKDASTETNFANRNVRCISDGPIYQNLRYKTRNSYHRDLDEALSSLLWQPYEYQRRNKSEHGSSEDISSNSDLDEPNNGPETPECLECTRNLPGQWSDRFSAPRDRQLSNETSRLSASSLSSECVRVAPAIADDMSESLLGPNLVVTNPENVIGTPQVQPSVGQLRNLSSVNIVGLPNQPRPPQTRVASNQFKYNANIGGGSVGTTNHQRHSSQIVENQPQLPIVHMRSASVPKKIGESLPMVNHQRNGSDLCKPDQRRLPLNVSNVNVNYYRAVPANVVSTVPQIQCVNTSNDCVSNVNIVQAMPIPYNPLNNLGQTATTSTYTNSPIFSNIPSNTSLQQCAVTTFGSSIITQHFPSGNTYNVTQSPQNDLIQNLVVPVSSTTTEVTVHAPQTTQVQIVRPNEVQRSANDVQKSQNETPRTFTSTEAQTDDTITAMPDQNAREQRRRERRERRHHRRVNSANHRHTQDHGTQYNVQQLQQIQQVQQIQQIQQSESRLPDILNSHLPPSYNSAVAPHQQPLVSNSMVPPPQLVQTMVPSSVLPNGLVGSPIVSFQGAVVPGQVPLVQPGSPVPVPVAAATGFRFPFQGAGFRRTRYTEEPPKSCCGLLAMKPGSLRWFIALIAFVAVCCVLVGTVLGAMRSSGRDHLTVSLLMIGVGIVLITVSGIAWKLTSHDSSTCRSMLGLGSTESVDVCARRFVPRLPPSYGRPHHPYAAMMYPEFQYRPPPPSYQASMQEYRLRLLLLDRGNTPQIQAGIQNAVSPPPTYRSHAGSLLRAPLTSNRRDAQSEYSCPPSYRSQTSSTRPTNTLPTPSILHSREQSLSLSESNHDGSVNVVLHNTDEDIALDNITLDSLKMEPENDLNPLKMMLKGSTNDLEGSKDGNLVTIVQTNDQSPVIVTVSGSSNTDDCNIQNGGDMSTEMQILAHL